MAGAVGGSVVGFTLRGRAFTVPADVDIQLKSGGKENEVKPNGDMTARVIKTASTWSIKNAQVVCNNARGDEEYMRMIADSVDFFPITIELADGTIKQGNGQIVDGIEYSSQNATITFGLAGTGSLEVQ